MYHKLNSQKAPRSPRGRSVSKEITATPSYGSLSSVVQRAQDEPSQVSDEELQQLDSAIGTRAVAKNGIKKATRRMPAIKGISNLIRGNNAESKVPIQTKLWHPPPVDKYEQEADRVAVAVVQKLNRGATEQSEEVINPKEHPVREGGGEPPTLTTMVMTKGGSGGSAELTKKIERDRGGGKRLEPRLSSDISQVMRSDFRGVRVHTDSQADQYCQSLQAKAFTIGKDVFFRRGEYQPGRGEGKELIAHELTHVLQQRAVGRAPTTEERNCQPPKGNSGIEAHSHPGSPPGRVLIQRKEGDKLEPGTLNIAGEVHVSDNYKYAKQMEDLFVQTQKCGGLSYESEFRYDEPIKRSKAKTVYGYHGDNTILRLAKLAEVVNYVEDAFKRQEQKVNKIGSGVLRAKDKGYKEWKSLVNIVKYYLAQYQTLKTNAYFALATPGDMLKQPTNFQPIFAVRQPHPKELKFSQPAQFNKYDVYGVRKNWEQNKRKWRIANNLSEMESKAITNGKEVSAKRREALMDEMHELMKDSQGFKLRQLLLSDSTIKHYVDAYGSAVNQQGKGEFAKFLLDYKKKTQAVKGITQVPDAAWHKDARRQKLNWARSYHMYLSANQSKEIGTWKVGDSHLLEMLYIEKQMVKEGKPVSQKVVLIRRSNYEQGYRDWLRSYKIQKNNFKDITKKDVQNVKTRIKQGSKKKNP